MSKYDTDQEIKEAESKVDAFVTKLITNGIKTDCPHRTNLRYMVQSGKDTKRLKKMLQDKLLFYCLCHGDQNSPSIPLDDSEYCFDCGKYIRYTLKDGMLIPNDTECFEVKPCSTEISVPSGKMVLVDWPERGKEVLGHLDDGESINSFKGCVNRTMKYAALNFMHVFVGNTCPHVYQNGNILHIGRNGYDEEDKITPLMENGEDRGSVCTDLWWVTAFDITTYRALLEKKFDKQEVDRIIDSFGKWTDVIVDVEPGIYQFTHYYGTKDSDKEDSGPELFTKLEYVRSIGG